VKRYLLFAGLFVALVFLTTLQPSNSETVYAQAEATAVPETMAGEEQAVPVEIPFLKEWMSSAHANTEAEAFNHWNDDDPAVVPTACAKCHSTSGYRDFLGVDGSDPGIVDVDVPVGETITCIACHNEATLTKDSVVMPSGAELTGLGREARCMECHQGRESTVSVNEALAEVGVDEDTVSEDIGFLNIHYFAAAATKYGTLAKGGYEYPDKSYDAKFAHVDGYETCIGCHDSHTLQVKVEDCASCHEDVVKVEDLRNVRMEGSRVDYDGDGNTDEGIYYELTGLQEQLYAALQAYADMVAGTPIVYEPHSYPYFFVDTNANGDVDEGEAAFPNKYNAWTPRLLKAAYNYQTSMKDPGAFAHGGKYIIQLLYDSIEDLNMALDQQMDLSALHRIDAGHFAGSREAFRHWDDEGRVPGSCSKCHSAGGLPLYLEEGVSISQPIANGFQCTTCHDDLQEFTRYPVDTVEFPSGAVISSEEPNMNLCMTCHQGRESTVSVDALINGLDDDSVGEQLRFLNVHYFAAGATRYGTEAKGAYEYAGKEYVGFFKHANVNSCTDCHDAHSLEVKWEGCIECHEEAVNREDLFDIRYTLVDYDGDGKKTEGVYYEIQALREKLYTAIQEYASNEVGTAIVYDETRYPYYFVDTNENGQADMDEVNYGNRYNSWTPRLLRAAYNYQYATKDPGAFTHNGQYVLQILYDSLEDLGANIDNLTRPVTPTQ
jgi:hypothetical protein